MGSDRSLVYESAARRDLREIFTFIARENPPAAQKLKEQIDKQIGLLQEFPELGPLAGDDELRKYGYRLLVVGNYVIFYRIAQDEIEVKRVLHGARLYQHLIPGEPDK